MTALLSSAYFAPVQWFQKLFRCGGALIEYHDSFVKQTYRNRCVIATASGPLALTVPVVHAAHAEGKDIRISGHGNWRHLHWNAIASAYGEAPFFEFLEDGIRPFFEKEWTFLYDFNMEITLAMCDMLGISPDIRPTESYVRTPKADVSDYRSVIDPKHPLADTDFNPQSYYQVYARRNGFLPNLSIIDLLLNMGGESVLYL